MKKFMVLLIAVAMIAVVAAPASALESVFKGYWRTRAFTTQNFDGNDDSLVYTTAYPGIGATVIPAPYRSSITDWSGVDTRTRLFYTAIINDNLKFVNAFEIDAFWGSTGGGSGQVQLTSGSGSGGYNADGDFGTDGVGIEVKHSYVDFTLPWAPIFGKIGLQNVTVGRGFLLNEDFAAAVVGFKSDVVTVPLIWIKAYEGGLGYNKWDTDFYGIAPTIKPADTMSFTPFFVYAYSDRLAAWNPAYPPGVGSTISELNMYYAGLDVDLKFNPVSVWLTGIYQGGDADILGTNRSVDFKAWLAAAGFKVNVDMFEIHGQAFYATGDDNAADTDIKTFFVPSPNASTGQSYYWSEIMGLGVFDRVGNAAVATKSRNSCGDHISNIFAANVGVAVKPIPDLTITLDGWYAQLAEERTLTENVTNPTAKDDYLGTEVDLKITYQLVKNLNLDLVGAYLFMGDATYAGPADENPWEAGAQLSLTF